MAVRHIFSVFRGAPSKACCCCRLYSNVAASSLGKGRERVFVVGVGMTKFQKVTFFFRYLASSIARHRVYCIYELGYIELGRESCISNC